MRNSPAGTTIISGQLAHSLNRSPGLSAPSSANDSGRGSRISNLRRYADSEEPSTMSNVKHADTTTIDVGTASVHAVICFTTLRPMGMIAHPLERRDTDNQAKRSLGRLKMIRRC